ncbi:hypothetical protein ACFX1T_025513 [Malus domestica]
MKRAWRINGKRYGSSETVEVKRKMGKGTVAFGTLTCRLRGPLTDSLDLHRVLRRKLRDGDHPSTSRPLVLLSPGD